MPSSIPRPKWLIFLLLLVEWILSALSMFVIAFLIDLADVEPAYHHYTPFEYVEKMAGTLLNVIILLGVGYFTLGLVLAYMFYNREPYVSSVCISTAINILMSSPFIIESWSYRSSNIGIIIIWIVVFGSLMAAYIVLRIRPFSKWAITVDENEEAEKK